MSYRGSARHIGHSDMHTYKRTDKGIFRGHSTPKHRHKLRLKILKHWTRVEENLYSCLPHVGKCSGEGTLAGDEGVLLLVAVHVVGVDVVRVGVVVVPAQDHARVVVAQHVRIPVLGKLEK